MVAKIFFVDVLMFFFFRFRYRLVVLALADQKKIFSFFFRLV